MLLSQNEYYLLYKDTPELKKLIREKDLHHHDIKGGFVAVPNDVQTMFVLHEHAFQVPTLTKDYDWPHGKTPNKWVDSPQQKEVTEFLIRNPRSFLLSDPRTGKTISTLWAIDWLLHNVMQGARALILGQKSTLTDVWVTELERHFHGRLTYRVLEGDAKKRLAALKTEADVYIANYESIGIGASIVRPGKSRGLQLQLAAGSLAEELFSRHDIQIVAIDEVTAYKKLATQRSWIMRKFLPTKRYVWGITGTPNPNSPVDSYCIAKMIRTNMIEKKGEFEKKTMVRVGEHSWTVLPGAEAHAARVLSPHIRFAYGDVFEGDSQEFNLFKVPLSPRSSTSIKQYTAKIPLEFEGGTVDIPNEATSRLKLLQMAVGGVYMGEDENRTVEYLGADGRLEVLFDLMRYDKKYVLFLPYSFCAKLVIEYNSHYKHYGFEHIVSSMSDQLRAEAFYRFRNDLTRRFIMADPRLMSHGVNLSVADTIIWFGPIDRAEVYHQANRRVVKPGAKTYVYGLYATQLEKKVYQRQKEKQNFQGLVYEELARIRAGGEI